MQFHFLKQLQATWAEAASRVAIDFRGRTITFGEFQAEAQQRAVWLREQGVQPGDRVVLCAGEKLPFLFWHFGALLSGAVALPLNPKFTADELQFFLSDSGARVAVVGDEQQPVIEGLKSGLSDLAAIVPVTHSPEANAGYEWPSIAADDPCMMLYSSGTTGRPKGVVHTQANLAASLNALADCWRIVPDDIILNVLPLFHIHGLSFATQMSLLRGSQLLMDESFHPRRTLDLIGRATVFMAIPTFYYSLLERQEFRDAAPSWTKTRLFTCGSAPIRAEVLPELEGILGKPVINRYGMTEGHVLTSLPLDGPWPQGSVGLPLPGIELQILGENGALCGVGEVGHVQVCGPNLFQAYWRKPEATVAAFAGGWFDTGDLGQRDERGFLTLVGRKNDLIITNGFNVYPQVVERVVNECPGVAESAVIGVPDNRRGERVVVVVVRSDASLDEKALREHWTSRLVDYQRPSAVVFVESLPRNALGKVLRTDLRKLVAET